MVNIEFTNRAAVHCFNSSKQPIDHGARMRGSAFGKTPLHTGAPCDKSYRMHELLFHSERLTPWFIHWYHHLFILYPLNRRCNAVIYRYIKSIRDRGRQCPHIWPYMSSCYMPMCRKIITTFRLLDTLIYCTHLKYSCHFPKKHRFCYSRLIKDELEELCSRYQQLIIKRFNLAKETKTNSLTKWKEIAVNK